MLLMAVLITALNYQELFRLFGSGAPLAALIQIVAAFITGYLLGGRNARTRMAMGFMNGARNASIALMIASQVFGDQPQVLMMITLTVVLMLFTLLPMSYWLGRSVGTEKPRTA